jgi:hypothetical protein
MIAARRDNSNVDRRLPLGSHSTGIIGMAISDAALCPENSCELASAPLRTFGVNLPAPKLLTASVILCSMLLAGCARNPAQREVSPVVQEGKAPPVRTAVRTRRYPEPYRYAAPRIRRPDPALLSPQPAPDCEFNRSDLRTVDPNEWARLKVEYERQCYLDAERAARERLALLQTSSTCEVEPVQQRSPVRRQSAQPR